jgi:hypothetical protein
VADSVTFFFHLPPLAYRSNPQEAVQEGVRAYHDAARVLAQRLDDYGVSDGYEISALTLQVMKVVAFTPQAALILKCWGEHDRNYFAKDAA